MVKKSCSAIVCAVAFLAAGSCAIASGTGDSEPLEDEDAPPIAEARATTEDPWVFVVTPQIWGSRIEKNGFAAENAPLSFSASDAEAVDALDVQWGVQVAAQKGRWSFAVSFQTVDFTTENDIVFDAPVASTSPNGFVINPGDIGANERVNTTRYDVDLVASYFFPDTVSDRLDLAAGLGVKTMYARADRQFSNIDLAVADAFASSGLAGFYQVCDSMGCERKSEVSTTSWAYGAVIPLAAVIHLTADGGWLLPLNVTPFLGANTRDDNHTRFNSSLKPEDGTDFAYGVTSDIKLQWALTETLSAYAAMRVQYFDLTNQAEYFAWGPLIGLSARFGGV